MKLNTTLAKFLTKLARKIDPNLETQIQHHTTVTIDTQEKTTSKSGVTDNSFIYGTAEIIKIRTPIQKAYDYELARDKMVNLEEFYKKFRS